MASHALALADRATWQARALSPIALTLGGYTALSLSLYTNDGSRDAIGLTLVLVALVAWAKAFAGTFAPVESRPSTPATTTPAADAPSLAWVIACASVLLCFVRRPGYHIEGGLAVYYLLSAGVAVLVGSYTFDLRGTPPRTPFVLARRTLLFALAFLSGAWLFRASPNPLADVFPVHQQTAQALLDGKSIYTPGVIQVLDTYHHDFIIRSYTYLPLSAYLTTIAFAVTRDVRWANLVAELIGAGFLWAVAKRCASRPTRAGMPDEGKRLAPGTWADLFAAMLLFCPRNLVVLEKAWTEPLALPFLGGFVFFALERRSIAASVCLGLLCAIKQHFVLYVPFLALAPGVGLSGIFIAGGVALATMAPYLVAAPLDLYHGAFANIASGPFRTDALTFGANLYYFTGRMTPSWLGFASALVPLVWLAWFRRVPREIAPLLLGCTLVFGCFYVMGRQAFLNYYYLLDITALFAAATLPAGAGRLLRAT